MNMDRAEYKKLAVEFFENMRPPIKSKNGFIGEANSCDFVLMCIEQKGEITPKDISDRVGVSSARIAVALNELEEKELITREIDNDDRRRIIVKLTEKGKETVAENREQVLEKIIDVFFELGERDSKEYTRITGRILEIMQKYDC